MARNCIDILKNSSPDIHKYLEEKNGVYDGTEKSKQEWIKAAKELQDHSVRTLNDLYSDLGIEGFKKVAVTTEKTSIADEGIDKVGEVTKEEFGDKTIETDKGAMEGYYSDEIEINDEKVKLPKAGLVVSEVYLKEGVEKGNGSGQEIYKQALDKYGTLYSAHPISEDALNAQNALERKGLVTIRNEEIGGTDFRVIEKTKPEIKKEEPLPQSTVVENKDKITDIEKRREADLAANKKLTELNPGLGSEAELTKEINAKYDKELSDLKSEPKPKSEVPIVSDNKVPETINEIVDNLYNPKEEISAEENKRLKSKLGTLAEVALANNKKDKWGILAAKGSVTNLHSSLKSLLFDINKLSKGKFTPEQFDEIATKYAESKGDYLHSFESKSTNKEVQPSIENKPETNNKIKEVERTDEAKKFSEKAKEIADKIRTGKISKLGGFKSSTGFDAVWDTSLEVVAKTIEAGGKIADAIDAGLKHIRESEWYKNLTYKKDFEDKYREHLNAELGAEKPPKPPIDNVKENIPEGDGKNELREMALNIPNEGQLREYASKGTIEKYHGETPQNEQGIIVQELTPALEHGENMIGKAKDVFGEKEYVDKTLQFIEDSKLPTQSKALMYISLENDLARQKANDPSNLDIQKKQDLVRSKSQAFLRESSLAINFGKLRKIGEVGYDISKVTDNFFSPKEREAKATVEKSIEANAETINKEAASKEEEDVDLQQKISDAVEAEINKIHEKLSPEKKRVSDKAIAALENFQKKIRSKTYDATLGIPVAIIDTGITIIKNAIKAGVKIADAIDLGIQHIKEKYGKEWAKEGEFKQDMIDGFREQGIKKEASGTANQIIKNALIESGFGREITVTTKAGKEKRNILDWKKLAGEEGSIERMKENVTQVLEKQGYSKEEIADIQKDLNDQYNDLRASVIEHSINELNRRNQKHTTPEQKSAAKKLSELYNYGLFEKDPVEYDVLLSKAIGIDRLSPERFKKAHELGKALEILYSSKFNGKRLNDLELKTAIQSIEEKMRILLHDEAQGHGSTALKLADITRTYMDATQRMILNNLGQAVQNPLSGFQQTLISNIDRLFDNSSTPELRAQKRKVAISVYKDMVLSGGVNYGDVNTQFVSRGNLDAYINKMSDSKIFHAIASTAIGKTTLDAADSFYKSKLTDQKFTHNLIKVLQQKRLVDGKLVEGMSKQDAVNYVSEKLTGQSFEAAKQTAKEIIDKVNAGGKKIVNDSDAFVNRLANDIVKAALINGNVITTEQVTMSYDAAYESAGRSLGHVANNPVSLAVQGASAKIESKINEAVKNKEFKKAALLTYQSIFFRNIMNPFVGGGANWVVLKLEKNGLGLVTGLISGKTKLDLTSEAGLKDVEKALYEEARDRDQFMRGAIGGTTALLTAMLWFGVSSTDDYRKWRNRNKWASKYLDYVTPEAALATMAAKNDELGYYVGTIINKNVNYDKGYKIIKGVDKASGKGKKGEAAGQFGEAVGGSFGLPVPWRLVRDGQNIWLGASGKEPYKVSSTKSKGFWEGAIKAGMLDYIKNNPIIKKK